MSRWSIVICVALLIPCVVQADDSSVSFATTPLWLSSSHITEGRNVHISTVVMKTGNDSVAGTIIFYADTLAIGSAAFSLPPTAGGTVVDISWTPPQGTYRVSAKIVRPKRIVGGKEEALEIASASTAAATLIVDADANHNGIADTKEPKPSGGASAGSAPAHPQVAGVSTTTDASSTASDLFAGAARSAQSVGSALYKKTEQLRTTGADYSNKQLVAAQQNTTTTPTTWSWGGIKITGLKALSFFFDNIYLFYIVLVFIVLWLIRKIWRRYSLD